MLLQTSNITCEPLLHLTLLILARRPVALLNNRHLAALPELDPRFQACPHQLVPDFLSRVTDGEVFAVCVLNRQRNADMLCAFQPAKALLYCAQLSARWRQHACMSVHEYMFLHNGCTAVTDAHTYMHTNTAIGMCCALNA